MKAPVSVCMIARNEEPFIKSCLESIRPHVEEIVVLDTGSYDKTAEIAETIADRVERDASFIDEDGFLTSFSMAREASYAMGTQPWHMWLDADDVVVGGHIIPEFISLLEKNMNDTGTVHVGKIKYCYTFNKDGICVQSFLRERITPANAGFRWHRPIHEYIKNVNINVIDIVADEKLSVVHRGQHKLRNERNLKILLRSWNDAPNSDIMIPYYIGNTLALQGKIEDSNKWLEQCLSMPFSKQDKIRITAYKHLFQNYYNELKMEKAHGVICRFIEDYPLCASAYFHAARIYLKAYEFFGDYKWLKNAKCNINEALSLKQSDDDIFLNPWEWDIWAPQILSLIDSILEKENEKC